MKVNYTTMGGGQSVAYAADGAEEAPEAVAVPAQDKYSYDLINIFRLGSDWYEVGWVEVTPATT